MAPDIKLWALGIVLGAALLGALGYAVHLNAARDDSVRLECIRQGRVWGPIVVLGSQSPQEGCQAAR